MNPLLRLLRRLLPTFAALPFLALLAGGDCSGFQCDCFVCTSAIDLSVVDENAVALDAWTVEVTLDGNRVDSADANCDPAVRFGNACSFGEETGIYRITVRQEGFETREIAARFAARSGEDCCRCLPSTIVVAEMKAQ